MKKERKENMAYPLEKYKFVSKPARTANEGPTIIAISTYAGKTVKGYSRCHPNDFEHYDADYGNQLAAARCGVKVANKRVKHARQKVEEAKKKLDEAIQYYNNMRLYLNNAEDELWEANEEVDRLENRS